MSRHATVGGQSRVTSKGQTTIPKEVRDALRLNDGVRMERVVEEDQLVATVRPKTRRGVDLAGVMGRPPQGAGLEVEEMDDVIAQAMVERFERSTR